MKKVIGNSCGILIVGALLAAILLTLSFMLPVRDIIYIESVTALESEGWYPAIPILSASLDTHFHSYLPGVLDGHTDHIMLDTALNVTGVGNALYRAMDMFSEYLGFGYSYYWHGYVAILRPLMLFFNYEEIRIINGAAQFMMVLAAAFLTYRKKGFLYATILLSSYFLLMPNALSFSLQFSWVFYIGMGGCLYSLLHGDRMLQRRRYVYVFLVLGMLTSFLDLLTYPLYTWGIPLLWWLVTASEEEGAIQKLKKVIGSGFAWIGGYGGFWMLKWCLATVILKRNIWQSAINEIFIRSGLEEKRQMNFADRWESLWVNWEHYFYKLYALLLLIWLLFFVLRSLRNGFLRKQILPAICLVGVSPVIWYIVLSDHTGAHHFFTYRIWGITILAVLLLGAEGIGTIRQTGVGKRVVIWGFILGCSALLTFQTKEDFWILNGGSEHTFVELADGGRMEIAFQPSFRNITQYSLGIDSPGSEGNLEFSLYNGENLLDRKLLSLAEIGEKEFYPITVDWKLDPKQVYTIELGATGASDTRIMLTIPEDSPMTEYQGVVLDGKIQNGQPICGIMYQKRPDFDRLLVYGVTWSGILFAFVMLLIVVCGKRDFVLQGCSEGLVNRRKG